MDPSEYEDTVQKSTEVVDAGILEDIFSKPKFANVDLSKEAGEIYLQVFQIKEAIASWGEVNLEVLQTALDEQALRVADNKESYVVRKKALAANVRQLTQFVESSESVDEGSKEKISAVVTNFKDAFDFLSGSAKFSESSFIGLYKVMRDLKDPKGLIEECLGVLLKAQESLKTAQQQLNLAEEHLEKTSSSGPINAHQQAMYQEEVNKLKNALEAEREDSAKFQSELTDMRSRYEVELRNREQTLRSMFERQQLELQHNYEKDYASKEGECASLLGSLNEMKQSVLEGGQRENMLASETSKRREVEDKLRVTLTELADYRTSVQEMQQKCEAGAKQMQAAALEREKERKEEGEAQAALKHEIESMHLKLKELELDCQLRAPIDLSDLASKIGYVSEDIAGKLKSMGDDGNSIARRELSPQWSQIESFIVESLRRAQSQAAESCSKLHTAAGAMEKLQMECTDLKKAVAEKSCINVRLEEDLLTAHASVASTKQLLKAYQHGQRDFDISTQTLTPLKSPEKALNGPRTPKGVYSTGTQRVRTTPSGDEYGDVEAGAGGQGAAEAILGDTEAHERMLKAVMSQRDRFMKSANEKEQEIISLKNKFERSQEEQMTLREENLELYRRLRVLRVASNSSSAGTHADTHDMGYSSLSSASSNVLTVKSRGKKYATSSDLDRGADTHGEDTIDLKYNRMYEEKIDPFRMEELDRQSVLSRMNILEQALAYMTRTMMQDRWARHALLVYLFLVHCFAFGYVVQILNPQLIEEVDSMNKQWSEETLNMNMHREHPDVR